MLVYGVYFRTCISSIYKKFLFEPFSYFVYSFGCLVQRGMNISQMKYSGLFIASWLRISFVVSRRNYVELDVTSFSSLIIHVSLIYFHLRRSFMPLHFAIWELCSLRNNYNTIRQLSQSLFPQCRASFSFFFF